MGKTAEPGTPYCSGFTQGAISVGGQIFTTENLPISYTLSGKTATISDATGVIGEADLTGKLIEASRTKANPGIEYCGAPYAELKVGNITFGTENPPISYALRTKALRVNGQFLNLSKDIQSWTAQQQSGGVEVDWGGGDVVILPGETWNVSDTGGGWWIYHQYRADDCRWLTAIRVVQQGGTSSTYAVAAGDGGYNNIPPLGPVQFGQATDEGDGPAIGPLQRTVLFYGGSACRYRYYRSFVVSPGATSGHYLPVDAEGGGSIWAEYGSSTTQWTVTTNTGATSSRTQPGSPSVSLLPSGCPLVVTYTDGTTQSFTYAECPTVEPVQCAEVSDSNGTMGESCPFDGEATAICYDYDITEVKYTCEGSCPSAEFECRCEETNTLMCYGWDPNNPDVFKPLFVTSITSG